MTAESQGVLKNVKKTTSTFFEHSNTLITPASTIKMKCEVPVNNLDMIPHLKQMSILVPHSSNQHLNGSIIKKRS